ncbi:ABC transporter substrate-binding protein [Georgenia phoenicis]|uniref:ABC transporter substrate-binding protein n=1 Tax=unclassified Georgenia TaxID=2626815 RepID=UPI0039AE9A05
MNSLPLARRTALAASAAAALLLVSACGGGEEEGGEDAGLGLVNEGTLTACSNVPFPPFEVEDPEAPSGYSGFDIDLLQAMADEMELELEVLNVSFEALQSGSTFAAGQCDIGASAITITEEREENLTFSEPYYDSLQSLLVAPGSGIESIDDLEGKSVGVQAGTTGLSYAQENAEGATLVEYPGNAELWSAIQAGQIDAILQDLPVNLENAQADPSYVIVEEYETDEQYGYAMSKDASAELVEAVDSALQTLRDDGTYQEIYDSYFSVNPQ